MRSPTQLTPAKRGAEQDRRPPDSHDPEGGAVAAAPAATSAFRRAFDAARERWPALGVDFQRFRHHLEELGYVETKLPRHPSELYLCIGCGLGTRSACRALEVNYFKGLRARLRSVASEQDFAEEVLQRVRARLLVGSKPRIVTYRGDGPLGAWLHVVAANVARDYLRSCKKRRSCSCPLDTAAARLSDTASVFAHSPEDDALAANDVRAFEQGLVKAVLELTGEERRLLHHYFVSGLSIDVLGSMYSINRSTAARRIQRNVERIRHAVRRELSRSAISLGSAELAAFWPTLGKRLTVNASSLLGPEDYV